MIITSLLVIALPTVCLAIAHPKKCAPDIFSKTKLPGGKILSIEAYQVPNCPVSTPKESHTINLHTFCNVTITYTHPSQNDSIQVQVWLPQSNYNGRLKGIGGSGWEAGLNEFAFSRMQVAVDEGFATLSTNAGLYSFEPSHWALLSSGRVNLNSLRNLASVSLNDAAILGKSTINKFYGRPPRFSYWSGCSQGGRQGLMLAQHYPDAYDGIEVEAPVINWGEVGAAGFWPAFVMDRLGVYPRPCELDFIRLAAVEACDASDGLKDNIISDPDLCYFHAEKLVGKTIECDGPLNISAAAVKVAKAVWEGPRDSSNSKIWFGMKQDASLTSSGSLSNTVCDNNTCSRGSYNMFEDWIKYFVLKDASADTTNLSRINYDEIFRKSVKEYTPIIGTNDPDLSRFHKKGGKLLAVHGLADDLISPDGTKAYYTRVQENNPKVKVQDYFRLFFAPGHGHCYGGDGPHPSNTFAALQDWVELGKAPRTLDAVSFDTGNGVFHRPLCPYPTKQKWRPNARTGESEFYCK